MPILTLADKDFYFPDLRVPPSAIPSAIARAEILAQSDAGAGRNLSIHRYSETCNVSGDANLFLSFWPIVEGSLEIRVRRPSTADFGRSAPPGDWMQLEADQFEVDLESGEVQLKLAQRNSAHYEHQLPHWTRFENAAAEQARVVYEAGFDFAQDPPSYEVQQIKNAVASLMLTTSGNPGYMTGQKDFTMNGFYSVSMRTDAGGSISSKDGSVASDFLQVLRKYQPRSLPA